VPRLLEEHFEVEPVAAMPIAKKSAILRISDIVMYREGVEVVGEVEAGQ
jgi:hypothetical protein